MNLFSATSTVPKLSAPQLLQREGRWGGGVVVPKCWTLAREWLYRRSRAWGNRDHLVPPPPQ